MSPYLGSITSNIFFSLFYSFFCLFCLLPNSLNSTPVLHSSLLCVLSKKCWYPFLSYWDWLSAIHLQILTPWGKERKGKRSISLCVCTSVISACSFSIWTLPNVAGSEQNTELCGTSTAGQPWCHTYEAACGVPEAQAAHTAAFSCSETRTEPPTAMNITGMR